MISLVTEGGWHFLFWTPGDRLVDVVQNKQQNTLIGRRPIAQAAERAINKHQRPAGPRPIKRIEQTRDGALLILGDGD